jgi:hypothetical protein
MTQPKLIPTILCGGSGSRLWPVSRELHPKPFIRLADGQSLLQKAFLRGAQLPDVAEVLTITNRELFFKTEDEFREVNQAGLGTSFVLEPFGRNTAAAIAAAALNVAKTHGDDALLLVLAADHLIADQAALPCSSTGQHLALQVSWSLLAFSPMDSGAAFRRKPSVEERRLCRFRAFSLEFWHVLLCRWQHPQSHGAILPRCAFRHAGLPGAIPPGCGQELLPDRAGRRYISCRARHLHRLRRHGAV